MNPHSEGDEKRPDTVQSTDVKMTYERQSTGVKKDEAGEWVALVFWYEGRAYRCPRWLWRVLFVAEQKHGVARHLLEMPIPVLRYLLAVVKANVGN